MDLLTVRTWVAIYSFVMYFFDTGSDGGVVVGLYNKVWSICLRFWHASVVTCHFDWSIGSHLRNQNVKKPLYQTSMPEM